MRRNRRVKIVATLGPASNNEETMRSLFNAGADVFRVNMSHATHEGLREAHGIVRKLEIEASRPIGILVDLQGPKLRIGKFESGAIRLTEGDILSFVRREAIGGLGRVQLPHPEIFEAVKQGHTLLLDDGKFRLRVVEASDVRIDAEVMTSGVLGSRKGISLPDTVLPLRALTDKDRADVDFALSLGVSWIALSFVQRAEDIAEAKKLARGRAAVMAKIEKPSALTDLKNIVEIADGIMVARGDLGVVHALALRGESREIEKDDQERRGRPLRGRHGSARSWCWSDVGPSSDGSIERRSQAHASCCCATTISTPVSARPPGDER
jgi:pyruvate kinase